ncbi:MAG TPA: HD domain-containing protein, partial [Rhodocyclaceae bacterium]|nr:HD domain-containing protein [Rhodocyclaceae bacterium]
HARAVAAVARALAAPLHDLELPLVTAGGLLHDIAKGQPAHAEAGAERLEALGYPQVAAVIRRHMDLNFTADAGLDEAAVVFLADTLVREDRRVALESRFRPAFERFADQPEALAGARRKYDSARQVLEAIEGRAGRHCADMLRDCGVPA